MRAMEWITYALLLDEIYKDHGQYTLGKKLKGSGEYPLMGFAALSAFGIEQRNHIRANFMGISYFFFWPEKDTMVPIPNW